MPMDSGTQRLLPTADEQKFLTNTPYGRFVAQIFTGMPSELAGSFSERQLFALYQAFVQPDGSERRAVWQQTLVLPWGCYRVTIHSLLAKRLGSGPINRLERRGGA